MKKTLITILLVLLTATLFVACSSSDERYVTIHTGAIPTKASEWSDVVYVLQADHVATEKDNFTIYSCSAKSEVTVKYKKGDTIYDVITNRIYVTEPARKGVTEYSYADIITHITRYGIPNIGISTTGYADDYISDWNTPVTTSDLYICFKQK